MLHNKKVAVVIPAHNEEGMIKKVIETIPTFVDVVVVVDDASKDATVSIVTAIMNANKRVVLLSHSKNLGVGAAIVTGYTYARDHTIDVTAVMAGDGQMDPTELESLCFPVAENKADYVKGNRLIHPDAWKVMPKYRFIGNSVLSLLTKIASGYWFLTDTQTGYTALSLNALQKLQLNKLYKRYGFPNDMFVKLNVIRAHIKEIPIKPIYFQNGKSGISVAQVIPKISWLLLKGFFWRLKEKYIIRDFHPLVFFYLLGLLLGLIDIALIIRLLVLFFESGRLAPINTLAVMFVTITSFQFLLFAMWFDMDYNKELKL
jgi:glycosyltransferase involved in cell wall biosynthesis